MCDKVTGTCSCRVGWKPPLCQGDSGLRFNLSQICTMYQTCTFTSTEAEENPLLPLSLLLCFFLPLCLSLSLGLSSSGSLSLSLSLSCFSYWVFVDVFLCLGYFLCYLGCCVPFCIFVCPFRVCLFFPFFDSSSFHCPSCLHFFLLCIVLLVFVNDANARACGHM